MKISTKPFILLGLALFLYIIYSVGIEKIISAVLKVDFSIIIFSTIFIIPAVLLKAYKWKLIVEKFGINLSMLEATKYWVIGLFIGNFTPGRAGDFVRTFYLNKKGLSLGKSLSTIVADRIFDIFTLFILSAIGVLIIMYRFGNLTLAYTIAMIFVATAFALFLILKRESTRFFLKPIFNFFVPQKYKEKFREQFHEFFAGIDLMKNNKKTLLYVFLISTASWIIGYLQSFFILQAFGYNINFIYIITFLPIEVLVSLIPITVSGFGTREATLIAVLGLLSIPAETAVAFGIVGMIFSVWIIALVGAVVSWRTPMEIKL